MRERENQYYSSSDMVGITKRRKAAAKGNRWGIREDYENKLSNVYIIRNKERTMSYAFSA